MNWPAFLTGGLWWALGALLPLVVVMYLLKLKRRRVILPSTLLWRRSLQDMVANSPFQRLRNNLLMWLQLLLLLLLILAFMRPVMKLQNASGSTLLVLIDNSASMQVVEGTESRLEAAKRAALEAVDSIGNNDEAMIITFSDRTSIVQTLTSDRGALRRAIEAVEPRDVETTLAEAGLILQGLTTTFNEDGAPEPRTRTRTLVISDGAVRESRTLADIPNVEYVRVGDAVDNLGISNVDVRESFADRVEYQVFATVTNSSEIDVEALVEFELDGEIVDIKAANVPAGGTAGVVFTTPEQDRIARIRVDARDGFALDDEVTVRIAPRTELEVLLVSNGNDFLRSVFSIDPRVRLSIMRPVDYSAQEDFDIVIFDSAEAGELPSGNFVFFNATPPIPGFANTGEVENPVIVDWNRVHPLMRYANFEDVLIGRAIDMDVPPTAIALVEAGTTPLITLYESEVQRVLVIGFDVYKSYWPLDVSFPIFMSNLIEYLSRTGQFGVRASYRTGEIIPINPTRTSASALVRTPDDRQLEFSFEGINTAFLTETHKAGLYHVAYDSGETRTIPVNLLSEGESLIAPADSLDLGSRVVEGADEAARVNREVWHYLALAALALLLLEWVIYCRRTFM
jgi:hypothetical protein